MQQTLFKSIKKQDELFKLAVDSQLSNISEMVLMVSKRSRGPFSDSYKEKLVNKQKEICNNIISYISDSQEEYTHEHKCVFKLERICPSTHLEFAADGIYRYHKAWFRCEICGKEHWTKSGRVQEASREKIEGEDDC